MSHRSDPPARTGHRETAVAPARPAGPARVDALLLSSILLLVAVGLVFVYSASAVRAGRAGDEFHLLKRQLLAAGIGFGLMLLTVKLGTDRVARLAYPLMGVALLLLLLVPLVGKTAGGAQRWIPLGPLNLQPSEVAKVALVLYLARSLARKQDKVRLFSIGLVPHVIVTAVVAGLCLWQKDLGTGFVVFLVLLAMLFAAGARVVYLLGALAAALPLAYHLIRHTEYRWQRVVAFLDPVRFKDTIGFQLWESLVLTSKGGWLGQGLGQGRARLYYLPAASTDFIAAVIAEEAGLLGVALLIGLFAVLVWRGLRATLRARDAFGCYAALGMTTLVGGQALVNLAVVLGMLPTKGLTLPFVSYGGSSLLTLLAGAGVLLAVSADRGGFLVRRSGAVRVSTPAETVSRLRAARAEEAP
jgi:cell division protein FtsW